MRALCHKFPRLVTVAPFSSIVLAALDALRSQPVPRALFTLQKVIYWILWIFYTNSKPIGNKAIDEPFSSTGRSHNHSHDVANLKIFQVTVVLSCCEQLPML